MIAIVDVYYREDRAVVGVVLVEELLQEEPSREISIEYPSSVGNYEPGHFWKRELGPIVHALSSLYNMPETVMVDGYVSLGEDRPGLGAYLEQAFPGLVVVGVAKNPFRDSGALPVVRGGSKNPLWVSGAEAEYWADQVRKMAGPYRIPALIKRADHISRA